MAFDGDIDKKAVRRDLEDRLLKPKSIWPAHWLPGLVKTCLDLVAVQVTMPFANAFRNALRCCSDVGAVKLDMTALQVSLFDVSKMIG